jgi:hypothetical protein
MHPIRQKPSKKLASAVTSYQEHGIVSMWYSMGRLVGKKNQNQKPKPHGVLTRLMIYNPNEPLDELANDGDRECDRMPAGPVNGDATNGVTGFSGCDCVWECPVAFNTSGGGADLALGDTGANPTVLMWFGWNSPRRTEVFILKSANLSCHLLSSSILRSE